MTRLLCFLPACCLLVHGWQGIGSVELTTFDGRRLVMENYAERTGTAVLFLSSRCPATERAAAEINRINRDHRLQGILLVGIFSNPAEDSDEVRAFVQRRGFLFPFYRDPQRKAARQFGARVTPEAFLLDRGGAIVYRGAIAGLGAAVTALAGGRAAAPGSVPAEGTPIERSGARREVDDPYGSIAFSSELIFERVPGAPAHHASTIAEAANGDLLVLWYGGSYESADDQALFLARRKTGERGWSRPEVLVRDSLQPPGNGVIFRDSRGRVWIVWARMEASRPLRRGGGWSQCRLFYRTSDDHGATWSEDRPFQDSMGWLPRNVPVSLPGGALLLPMSSSQGSFFLRTGDHGATWTRSNVVPGGGQPAAACRPDGSLLALLRRSPRLWQTESFDGGLTWAAARPTGLKNPNAGIAMTALRNGHLILVFNDSETARTPLSITRSLDGGKTWEPALALEPNPGEYSYPSVIQGSGDRIHITYTFRRYSIKHVEMDEGWLTHLERPN